MKKGRWKSSFFRFLTRPGVFVCVLFILVFVFCAIFADFVAPYEINQSDYSSLKAAPSSSHLLGTDELGRDILSRMIYASRISIVMGILPTTINLIVGTVLGMIAGMGKKWIDSLIMRTADIVLSYPFMILAMAIVYSLGPSISNLILTLIIVGWASVARIIRAQTLTITTLPYVEASVLMGRKKPYIMFKHILPNVKSLLIVLYTMAIPTAILAEASMSFLGFGAQPPQTSLGVMVSKGRQYLFDYPWISLAPALYILLLSVCLNYLGDALRDYYEQDNPELKIVEEVA